MTSVQLKGILRANGASKSTLNEGKGALKYTTPSVDALIAIRLAYLSGEYGSGSRMYESINFEKFAVYPLG